MSYIYTLLSFILLNVLFTINTALCEEVSDKPELNCTATSCGYLLNVEQPGFFVVTVQLPEGAAEGFWSLSAERRGANIASDFHLGATLMENGQMPGFFAFIYCPSDHVNSL